MRNSEKETIIIFNQAEDMAEVYSCQPHVWSRMKKLGVSSTGTLRRPSGTVVSRNYTIPVGWVLIRRPRQVSKEQRRKLAKHLSGVRNLNLKSSSNT